MVVSPMNLYKEFLLDWSISLPFILGWLCLTILDFFMGLLGAVYRRDVQSSKWREGVMGKAAILLILVGVAVVDPLIPNVSIPLGATALTVTVSASFAVALVGSELKSMAENLGQFRRSKDAQSVAKGLNSLADGLLDKLPHGERGNESVQRDT